VFNGIAVIKPVSPKDANSGGFVEAKELAEWIEKAHREKGWCGGVGFWQLTGELNTTLSGIVKNATVNITKSCGSLEDKLLYGIPRAISMPETEINN